MPDPAIDPRLAPGLPPLPNGTTVTVGTFDGLHRGHWAVLDQLRRHATEAERPAVLVTFHPHPLRVLRPEDAPALLTTPAEKKELLAESGIDYVVFVPFTTALAEYAPQRFVEEILIGRLQLAHLVIGYDHGFGRGRSGDAEVLRRIGAERGYRVDVVAPIHEGDAPISSSRIRRLLRAGDVVGAAGGLGRPYSLQAVVVRGEGRGRGLGFPTANLHVEDLDKLLPLEGIYAVRAAWRDGIAIGVLHLGPRPTFQGSSPSVELHLFEFEGDLYGEPVRVEFCARLREIHRFDSAAALVSAMEADCAAARRVFAEGGGACQQGGVELD